MKSALKLIILTLLCTGFAMSSCVTKKKYEQAVARGRRSLDSLNRVFNKTVEGFNAASNTLKISNASKDISVDSLKKEVKKLSGDKEALNQSLIGTINDYKREMEKLAQKTRMADSLKNILSLQAAAEDSVRTLSDNQKRDLDAFLVSFTKQFTGFNQSEVYAVLSGGNVVITFSNDFLFKGNTSEFSVKGAALLKKIATVLTLNENSRVHVISNTDNNGQAKTLLETSVKRAAAIISEFAATCTLPGSAYLASGKGMYRPLVSNDNAENKKKNRRTDIIITK